MHATNWHNLMRDVLLPAFRQPRWLAWVRALIGNVSAAKAGIVRMHDEFLLFAEETLQIASTNGTAIRLEIRLNRKFIGTWVATVVNPITLSTRDPGTTLRLFSRAEDRPLKLFRRGDARPLKLFRRSEYIAAEATLVVRCPLSLHPRRAEISAEIDRYLPAFVNYTLIFY